MNLGLALATQGTRVSGADSLRLLTEAVAAYQAALEIFTRDSFPQDWARTQMNLGLALATQGTRTSGADSLRLLTEAVAAYQAALEIFTRDSFPQDWARTQMNLGLALATQGTRTSGADSLRLLTEAIAAYQETLEIFQREAFPIYWDLARSNMVEVRFLLGDWQFVKQDVTFLLQDSFISNDSKVALYILLILALMGESEKDDIPAILEQLRTLIVSLPFEFVMVWRFETIKQFLQSEPQFASSKDWAVSLIQAVEQQDRGAILKTLDSVIIQFTELQKL
ncbi:MAG: tetratricopeptide repeat protein [Nitrospirales bacterium]|nr:tetratricopeptide repeat protein [Nitrospirales bacterium]